LRKEKEKNQAKKSISQRRQTRKRETTKVVDKEREGDRSVNRLRDEG